MLITLYKIGEEYFHLLGANRQGMKDLLLRARVVVRTSNIKISRRCLADYVKKLHQKACDTWCKMIFPHSKKNFIDLCTVVADAVFFTETRKD